MNRTNNNIPLRALIVEDAEDDTLLLADHLENAGFRLQWRRVDTEDALLAALEQESWDIVFSDFAMPRFRGDKALALVRQRDPDIPYIFVSGTIGEATAVAAMKAGAQDYVMKGNLARLAPAVRRELEEARSRRERRRAEQALRKVSQAVEQTADCVFITDLEGRIEYVNPAFERLTGYSGQEARGRTPALLQSGQHDARFFRRLWETILMGQAFRETFVNRRKDGEIFFEEKTIAPLTDDQGRITHFVSTGRDATERVRAEEARTRLIAILEATTDFVAIANAAGQLLYLNRAGRTAIGLGEHDDLGSRTLWDGYPEQAAERVMGGALSRVREEGIWQGETVLRGADGKDIPVSQVVLAHRDSHGDLAFYSTIARDITERKRFESDLRHQATHDALTGLPNRLLLADRIQSEVNRVARYGKLAALLFMDIDNFKRVNDTLGHAAGDALLKAVAQRLCACLRPDDLVARYGGDEFAAVVSDLSSIENIVGVIHKLYAGFDMPLRAGAQEIFVTFSMGIAIYPQDGESSEILSKNADTAMYRAKMQGRAQHQFYAPDMNARGQELLLLETDLRRALTHQEFALYYQPQFDVRRNRIESFEALLRWRHPTRGLVTPLDFIPMLEDTGLIVPVGEWVLRQACAHARACRAAGYPLFRIAVNVSARQFAEASFVDMVRRVLKEESVQPEMLELEITENIVMREVQAAQETLSALDAIGVRLAVDDFGTGYSSLAYLKRFPLDVLKIDRCFVQGLPGDANDAAISEASISLAHRLGLQVVAEGVETQAQSDFLRACQCDMLQGYLFSRPVPGEEMRRFLK